MAPAQLGHKQQESFMTKDQNMILVGSALILAIIGTAIGATYLTREALHQDTPAPVAQARITHHTQPTNATYNQPARSPATTITSSAPWRAAWQAACWVTSSAKAPATRWPPSAAWQAGPISATNTSPPAARPVNNSQTVIILSRNSSRVISHQGDFHADPNRFKT